MSSEDLMAEDAAQTEVGITTDRRARRSCTAPPSASSGIALQPHVCGYTLT